MILGVRNRTWLSLRWLPRHTSRVTVYSQYLPSPAAGWEERVDCTQQLVVSDDAVADSTCLVFFSAISNALRIQGGANIYSAF